MRTIDIHCDIDKYRAEMAAIIERAIAEISTLTLDVTCTEREARVARDEHGRITQIDCVKKQAE